MAKKSGISILNSEKIRLEFEIKNLKEKISKQNSLLKKLQGDLFALNQKINSAKEQKQVEITDHALVRYFERVLGLNSEEIIQKILSKENREKIYTLGGTCELKIDGVTFLIKDYAVVTVVIEK